ncbi:hypothetical protein [Porphyromonas circumdentaria]|uniref:Lipoprotein n=2 Tax=Porphyromonas circumdentaria TaxID=29524 RepID=A0A1T4LVP4_9PORP|nr:hypothetical protein [Porphyromonas circumdentaria]MBB6275413.1 hypothetical protein [Porphyromonas circumdentaria]SJZ58706.1 hypothetical protein SAMN02745171_00546 [Porphyromonas circumdentaria]
MREIKTLSIFWLLISAYLLVACTSKGADKFLLKEKMNMQEESTPSSYPSEPSPSTLHFSLVYAHHSDFDWDCYHFALKNVATEAYAPFAMPVVHRREVELFFGKPTLTEKPLIPKPIEEINAFWGRDKSTPMELIVYKDQGSRVASIFFLLREEAGAPIVGPVARADGWSLCRWVDQKSPNRLPYFEVRFTSEEGL